MSGCPQAGRWEEFTFVGLALHRQNSSAPALGCTLQSQA